MGKISRSRKSIRLKDFDYSGAGNIYFITICAANRAPHFSDTSVTKIVADELEFRRGRKEIKLFCYCIMPDHLHLLLSLTEDSKKPLQDWVSAFKRYTTRLVDELCNIKPLWQKNFYDRVVRKEESLLERVQYILHNPVRKGMVLKWEEYPFSKMVDPLPM